MADMNFPPNPVPGEQYTAPNGVQWTYDIDLVGGGWSRAPGAVQANDPNVMSDTGTGNLWLAKAGLAAPIGANNTVLGEETGVVITTGKQNTLVGYKAGTGVATAHSNTILGFEAARNMASGGANSNVIIGSLAASEGLSNVDCTVIGSNAQLKNTGDQNSIIIGSVAIGSGPNTVVIGNDNINFTYLKGVTVLNAAIQTASYTLATVPPATTKGQIIWVNDGDPTGVGTIGNGVHCSSNGVNWVVIGTEIIVTA